MQHETILQFLRSVLSLFNDTLVAVTGQPVLAFFLSALLCLVVYALITWLARLGKHGKL